MNIQLLEKQSKTNRDFNKCIDVIAPFITGKKITKREIDKANNALLEAFGIYSTWTRDNGEVVKVPFYTLSKCEQYGSVTLHLYASDRHVPSERGESVTYLPEYERVIYLRSDLSGVTNIITVEDLKKYIRDEKYMPTKAQIIASFTKYEAINAKIRQLENDRSELPFHYHFGR